jgi:hypothetical protein
MAITRLSGGLTPGDGSDPRTFPAIWNAAADELETGYRYVQTLYFTSNGTFTKASYPWLRAIRVKCQAGGGGGAGSPVTTSVQRVAGAGGSGGNYAESFITDIAGLNASVTVTRGAGGAGGADGTGSAGGNSSFGALVVATGGVAGTRTGLNPPATAVGATITAVDTADFFVQGGWGDSAITDTNIAIAGSGGSAFLGSKTRSRTAVASEQRDGSTGRDYGAGGSGAAVGVSVGTTTAGGAGASGIVIVELYS